MEKNLYIDASHPNETRVVLKSGENIEDYEYEGLKNSLIKNNIYLGKVSRVEPSLQAAFVDFGNLWSVDYDSSAGSSSKIRSSVGVTTQLYTPIGPVNFVLAQPISKADSDKTQTFKFQIGTSF